MDKSISPVIAMITPGIVSLLMDNRGLCLEETEGFLCWIKQWSEQ